MKYSKKKNKKNKKTYKNVGGNPEVFYINKNGENDGIIKPFKDSSLSEKLSNLFIEFLKRVDLSSLENLNESEIIEFLKNLNEGEIMEFLTTQFEDLQEEIEKTLSTQEREFINKMNKIILSDAFISSLNPLSSDQITDPPSGTISDEKLTLPRGGSRGKSEKNNTVYRGGNPAKLLTCILVFIFFSVTQSLSINLPPIGASLESVSKSSKYIDNEFLRETDYLQQSKYLDRKDNKIINLWKSPFASDFVDTHAGSLSSIVPIKPIYKIVKEIDWFKHNQFDFKNPTHLYHLLKVTKCSLEIVAKAHPVTKIITQSKNIFSLLKKSHFLKTEFEKLLKKAHEELGPNDFLDLLGGGDFTKDKKYNNLGKSKKKKKISIPPVINI